MTLETSWGALERHRISIVITSYNQKAFLVEAINSALTQTLRPYEIVIADDCSTDGSVELVSNYAEEHPNTIRPIFQKRNMGVARNRSDGFRKATGDLVTWANGDDRLLPRKLELELETYLNSPDARWVYSQVSYVDALGERTGALRYYGRHRKRAATFEEVVTSIGREPAYQLIDRTILDQVGLFDEDLGVYEDWDFTIRLAKGYKSAYCPVPLYEYRQYGGGLSSVGKEAHLQALGKVYQKVLPLLAGTPKRAAARIKRKLNAELIGMYATSKLEVGRTHEALRSAVQAIAKNPMQPFYYELGVRCIFPAMVVDRLRDLKHRCLPNMR